MLWEPNNGPVATICSSHRGLCLSLVCYSPKSSTKRWKSLYWRWLLAQKSCGLAGVALNVALIQAESLNPSREQTPPFFPPVVVKMGKAACQATRRGQLSHTLLFSPLHLEHCSHILSYDIRWVMVSTQNAAFCWDFNLWSRLSYIALIRQHQHCYSMHFRKVTGFTPY